MKNVFIIIVSIILYLGVFSAEVVSQQETQLPETSLNIDQFCTIYLLNITEYNVSVGFAIPDLDIGQDMGVLQPNKHKDITGLCVRNIVYIFVTTNNPNEVFENGEHESAILVSMVNQSTGEFSDHSFAIIR